MELLGNERDRNHIPSLVTKLCQDDLAYGWLKGTVSTETLYLIQSMIRIHFRIIRIDILTPTKIIVTSLTLILISSLGSSSIGLIALLIILNENQILYLYSASAKVLSGIYGLTLTGFVFFRNELSREEIEDDSLTDAIQNLKSRYFKLLIFSQ